MLTEAEKRAAKLAVSRFGADRAGVQRVFQAVREAQARGEQTSLLEGLVVEKLLTSAQAEELRGVLEVTHLDLNQPTPPPVPDPLPAHVRTLGGCRLLRKLGEGGMGAVYLAYQEAEGRQVAVKVLAESLAANPSYVDRFYREARSGALLNHANIVRNLAVGRDEPTGLYYLVLEYVDGPSARQLLEQHGPLTVPDAVHIALDIARALEHAHSRNIVHRDIKPDNILLTRSGLAKLADLGLAKRTDEVSNLTAARQGFGTPYYMPYEQATNARHADGRSDIYALGATLYHLLTGEVPFAGPSHVEIMQLKDVGLFAPASDLNTDVPPALDQLLEKMLARDPDERYQTASELIIDLERCGLVPAVPSFADADLALQDPVVRQRLAEHTAATSLDVNGPPKANGSTAEPERDTWYLRYRRDGRWCKARATTEQVRRRLHKGKLNGDAEAAREPRGPFLPLREQDEFRDAVFPVPVPAPAEAAGCCSGRDSSGWWLLLGGGLAVSVLALVVLVVYKVLMAG
jgi:serine/threonine protein kinase